MKVKNKTKVLLKEITDNLEGEVGNLKEKHFNANLEKLAANKKKIENADQEFRADPIYIKLIQENGDLKEKVKRTDKELFDLNYRVK